MLSYYFQSGLRSLRRNPLLTGLMILTLAMGVAGSVATLSILHMMSNDPIPHKSARLLSPVIDNGPAENFRPGDEVADKQMAYLDVRNLLNGQQGLRRAGVFGIRGGIEAPRPDLPTLAVGGLAVSTDYFAMFETPFLYGAAWSAKDEANAAQIMILSRRQSEKMYGRDNPVGKQLRFLGREFQIVGVLDHWNPTPRYTHLISGEESSFSGEDQIYIPFNTAILKEISVSGQMWCQQERQPGYQGLLNSECTWLQFWFEVASSADVPALKSYLNAYIAEQKKLGRLQRPVAAQLFDVNAWMAYLKIVRDDAKLEAWLAFGFLSLCLVNTIGLLLAKFSSRAGEIGVRRALGASRKAIFTQFLIETGVIGVVGGVLGLPLSFLAIRIIAESSGEAAMPPIDWYMLSITFLLSICASLLAGLLPTWRACLANPALQLKSQ
jgi:putative ABC transport system permease protein